MRPSQLLLSAFLLSATACTSAGDGDVLADPTPTWEDYSDVGPAISSVGWSPEPGPEALPDMFVGSIVGASMNGEMITAQTLDGNETIALFEGWGSHLEFQFDTFTPTGWAMIGGYVTLDRPLAAGQVIEIRGADIIGCAGPELGVYDFDGQAEGAGTMSVEAEVDGDLVLIISADFGSVGHVEAVANVRED